MPLFQPKELPLCINCVHYQGLGSGTECHAPENSIKITTAFNLVSGVKQSGWGYRWFTCLLLRNNNWFWCRQLKQCGREGRWFRPKKNRPSPVTPLRAA